MIHDALHIQWLLQSCQERLVFLSENLFYKSEYQHIFLFLTCMFTYWTSCYSSKLISILCHYYTFSFTIDRSRSISSVQTIVSLHFCNIHYSKPSTTWYWYFYFRSTFFFYSQTFLPVTIPESSPICSSNKSEHDSWLSPFFTFLKFAIWYILLCRRYLSCVYIFNSFYLTIKMLAVLFFCSSSCCS